MRIHGVSRQRRFAQPVIALVFTVCFGFTITNGSMPSRSIDESRHRVVQGGNYYQEIPKINAMKRQLGSFHQSLRPGSLCTTKDSTSGVCRPLQNCSFLIENFYRSPWTVCAWEGHVPIVCCPGRPSDHYVTEAESSIAIGDQSTDETEINHDDIVHLPLVSVTLSPWRPSATIQELSTPISFAGENGRPSKPSQFYGIKNVNGTLLFTVRSPNKQGTSSSSSLKKQRCGVPSYNVVPDNHKRQVGQSTSNYENSRVHNPERSTSSIVGGTKAAIGSFPWIAAIFKTIRIGNGFRNSFLCGGSILSPAYIITAAHCFSKNDNPMIFSVRVGNQNLRTASDVGTNLEDVAVEKVIMHPDYEPPQVYNDVALLRLKRNLTLDGIYLLPICLPDVRTMADFNLTDAHATVIGFGSTQLAGKASSGELQQVALPIVDNEQCDEAYNQVLGMSVYFPRGITRQLLCAGYEDGGKDACQGDSGGPLMILDGDGHWNLIGIVSVGRSCAEPGFPGIYVNMANYISWVESETQS